MKSVIIVFSQTKILVLLVLLRKLFPITSSQIVKVLPMERPTEGWG